MGMGRYADWTNALAGISEFLNTKNVKLNKYNYKIETNIINEFSIKQNLEGSFSARVLLISKDFQAFKKYINESLPQPPLKPQEK